MGDLYELQNLTAQMRASVGELADLLARLAAASDPREAARVVSQQATVVQRLWTLQQEAGWIAFRLLDVRRSDAPEPRPGRLDVM